MKKKKISVVGIVQSGFMGECEGNKRCPRYLLPDYFAESVFVCDILEKFARRKVRIIIQEL